MEKSCHIPVMKQEIAAQLRADVAGVFLDCTLGGGGHVRAILDANTANQVVAADRDRRAILRAAPMASEYKPRLELLHAPFSQLAGLLADRKFDGILADLGVSSDQLRENRGFSFNDSAALDMRMDESQAYSAMELVNQSDRHKLIRFLRQGGIGREAPAIVSAVIKNRPIKSTQELAGIVGKVLHGRYRDKKGNPATVVFQALRIAVNRELEELQALLDMAPSLVKPDARLAIISFHSLEDKLVTKKMREWEASGTYPAMWRGKREGKSLGKLVTKKALQPSADEIKQNPASRSARLRVFQFSA